VTSTATCVAEATGGVHLQLLFTGLLPHRAGRPERCGRTTASPGPGCRQRKPRPSAIRPCPRTPRDVRRARTAAAALAAPYRRNAVGGHRQGSVRRCGLSTTAVTWLTHHVADQQHPMPNVTSVSTPTASCHRSPQKPAEDSLTTPGPELENQSLARPGPLLARGPSRPQGHPRCGHLSIQKGHECDSYRNGRNGGDRQSHAGCAWRRCWSCR